MHPFNDPLYLPGSNETPAERFALTLTLAGSPGQAYVERRGIPTALATAAGVRFDPAFGGRPALVVPLQDQVGRITALHGRFLDFRRGQEKMLTFGPGGGVINGLSDWRAEPLILVEGLFDMLSLAVCGWASVATIGRWAPWLPAATTGRTVWLAFDAGRPGDNTARLVAARLPGAICRRLLPPPHCQDWNTALLKLGRGRVAPWVRAQLVSADNPLLSPTAPTP